MLLTRIYLRNYRVYEEELDLVMPPGLVGIYGPNGSGKSTLLEAILFALWGKARTTRDQVRTTGVGADCVVEVEFEHEGHLYLVRRVLKGINSTVVVEVHCDGLAMASGTRDSERYVESVLGMDDAAFRASVFAEQKQLAAFSDHAPAERRRLVLQLLGVTPLDEARDAARRDARRLTERYEDLRSHLPDLEALRVQAADEEAAAEAAGMVSSQERGALAAAEERLAAAEATLERLEELRRQHDSLLSEGKVVRQELDSLASRLAEQRAELNALDAESDRLVDLERSASDLPGAMAELEAVRAAAAASEALDSSALPPEPPCPDYDILEAARARVASAREEAARLSALVDAAGAEVRRASEALRRSSGLSGEAECPVCGQPLGESFRKVQEHRAAELAVAQARLAELEATRDAAAAQLADAEEGLARTAAHTEQLGAARQAWQLASERHAQAVQTLEQAWARVLALRPAGTASKEALPPTERLHAESTDLQQRVEAASGAKAAADRLRGRLERRPVLEAALAEGAQQLAEANAKLESLRAQVRALGFDVAQLDAARSARDQAREAARAASERAAEADLEATRRRERAAWAAKALADGEAQHRKIADLESESRHVSRVAELLAEFRNTVVASVGPRLSLHAAQLFAELTDQEYEELLVDPETYQLQIRDGGRVFGLERFSGSEADLANLALRVAISEHIHFQSGGSVGLLVLDEVFGPLDEDRKARMLLALERLRARFRQVLVVTHDQEIKEQLPNAIEVLKRPGRRAVARCLASWDT